MSLNEFSTKLRYFRAKIRPLSKPLVWIPALLVLPAGYFLTEYLTSPEAFSFWEEWQTEQQTEAVSEAEVPQVKEEKPKEQSKQQNKLPGDQKLMDQLRLANGQAAARNGTNAPVPNQSQSLLEGGQAGGLDSLLLPAGASYNPSLGMNGLSGNKQAGTLVPVNPLQAALERYQTVPSENSVAGGIPAGVGVSNTGTATSNLDATGTVPSSPNPNGASYLEAATGMPTTPVSPSSPAISSEPTNATSVTTGAQGNSYSYLTGSQPATTNPVMANPVPVVQVVTPALQNSGSFLQTPGNATVTQPSVSVPPQSTVPQSTPPVTQVPMTPVPVGPVNYGPSAVSGGSAPGMPGTVGNYGQGVSPMSPGVGVVQPVMPAAGSYGSATYPNVPSATSNPGYPSNFINPGVQPVVPSQPNGLPSAIGGGNINTFSNPTGNP
ncbi:hypothetical protein NG798_12070 [Ancylothrix sp. C2]|uniref:hypothetical protein n=1 Tax=Ancylothrix sp. D3o TaxID=2953691 RepID=UPI0021BB0036|nr:hypothetical protein [Ancylothrix sp. D3o]MCT7950528.1 hypothetical protein [Ancylothrix sp. D3o]